MILIETCFDALNVKAALSACQNFDIPVMVSVSVGDRSGRTLTGQTLEAFYTSVKHGNLLSFGLNCSLGPVDALPIIREFAEHTDLPLVFKPNAGTPGLAEDGSVISPYSAADFAEDVAPVLDLVTYLGGCCGSSPEYIRTLRKRLEQ